ncbi:hypothetical protein GCM10010964_42990 [Caldovatus sediminis]|uniref:SPOR domain-containing protein n=1 Tax=Caldovatus sediminis TaxID=2041189 RepID=A0A8J2ZFI8_9PROT|nr:SPOR domain-containing protein [Caldovatus sediminis]GGG51134.1 hypothetical protein GCM10010964_42990 [Caldovatus sediminis]
MSDAIVPSYRVRPPEDGLSWRLLAIAGGVAAVLALGAAAWWGASRLGLGGPRGVPVIEPDPRPVKVRPQDPGGLRVAYQDEFIFDRNARERALPPEDAQLAPGPERPALERLRAQIAPPPAVMAPVAAPGPAGAAGAEPGQAAPQAASAPGQAAAASAPAAAEAPDSPAAFAPVAHGRIQVQLGALASEELARAEWERLARRMPELLAAFRPQILRFDRGEGAPPMWRLRVGGFADAATARAFCEQARGRGAACAVIGG